MRRASPALLLGLLCLALVLAMALLGPVLYPVDPWASGPMPFAPPLSEGAPLGTDLLGRDILAGVLQGARVSLLVGAVAAAGAVLLGGVVGLLAGFFRGAVDTVLTGVTEFFQTVPGFILSILLVSLFRPSLGSIVTAIALVSWPQVARVVRTQTLSLREREFVLAARLSGKPLWKVLLVDLVPHLLPPVLVVASVIVANAILTESALSFMGLGDPRLMSWGYMIGAARSVIRFAWWMSVFPGCGILLLVLGVNLLSDGLAHHLDPRRSVVRA
ncbi:ABC transporter permease [Roseomonas sp. OT10]|uniref:ABC transporter permease n=1 Tax=Roseomonas cutis TaxID=2897332 RepID=UPI001E35D507|nr:ABC transporter permease [Roseomonas sp. OT10]UFN48932.1 ABC transporter permease [Roseomonas sp. OT10]